uniref:Uncharacterized protein n=1 Tax=Tetradesmus obliquus TaxID=3088 RepID=A0A383VSE8_TETOB|eukprot:jgi/Sobl393_1/7608/SZX68111.1
MRVDMALVLSNFFYLAVLFGLTARVSSVTQDWVVLFRLNPAEPLTPQQSRDGHAAEPNGSSRWQRHTTRQGRAGAQWAAPGAG